MENENVPRPRCEKCKTLMSKNGKLETRTGVTYRFRCCRCGASKRVIAPHAPKEG